jgi:hypothetical protein
MTQPKSLVVQCLKDARAFQTWDVGWISDLDKAIRIAEIEARIAIQELQKLRARWNHSALTHDCKGRKGL